MVLTQRDKKLLVFLGIFLIVVGLGWFCLKPLADNIKATKNELSKAEELKSEIEEKIMLLPSRRSLKDSVTENLEQEALVIYPLMQSQNIDKLLTNLVLSYGLEARQLDIAMNNSFFKTSAYALSSAASAGEREATGIYAANVYLELGGDRDSLEAIVDTLLNNYHSIRITSYNWIESTSISGGYDYILRINLNIYMFILNVQSE